MKRWLLVLALVGCSSSSRELPTTIPHTPGIDAWLAGIRDLADAREIETYRLGLWHELNRCIVLPAGAEVGFWLTWQVDPNTGMGTAPAFEFKDGQRVTQRQQHDFQECVQRYTAAHDAPLPSYAGPTLAWGLTVPFPVSRDEIYEIIANDGRLPVQPSR